MNKSHGGMNRSGHFGGGAEQAHRTRSQAAQERLRDEHGRFEKRGAKQQRPENRETCK